MCGCGRPARTNDQPQREQVRRQSGAGSSGRSPMNEDGFVWRGPRRQPQREQAEPTRRG